MFRWTERTKRRWCRRLFGLGCLAPTLAVLVLCAWLASERYRRRHEAALGELIGLEVRIAAVEHPRPGEVRYRGLEVLESDGQRPLASVAQLDCWNGRGGLSLVGTTARVDAALWPELSRLIAAQLRRRGPAEPRGWQLRLARAEWIDPQGALALAPLELRVENTPAGRRLQTTFQPADAPLTERCRVVVSRDGVLGAGPKVEWTTGQAALPCRLWAPLLPVAGELGPASRFAGRGYLIWQPDGPEGEFQGRLVELDLHEVVSRRLPHRLSGRAEMLVQRAQFFQGRLTELAASLSAGPGVASRSLFDALWAALGTRPARRLAQSDLRLVDYERIELGLVLDQRGLALRGLCPPGDIGAMVVDRQGPLLRQPDAMQTTAALIQALAPTAGTATPAWRAADALARHLPWPELPATSDLVRRPDGPGEIPAGAAPTSPAGGLER